MRYRILFFISGLIAMLIFQSCTEIMCILSGYKPSEILDDLETPEPGTEIDAMCNLIIKHASDYAVNLDSVYSSKKNLLELAKPYIRDIQDLTVSGKDYDIPVRIYCNTPINKRDSMPVILYFHGGGFIWGTIDIFDRYCRKLAKETGTILISVDYRLAPEHPFPYAVKDAYDVLRWTHANINNFGGDPSRIIVMGESAGANIAAVMTIMSRDSCGPPVSAQVICCPVTTFEEKLFPSRRYFMLEGKTYMISDDYMYRCRDAYIPDSVDVNDPYISPLKADIGPELPPALIITAQVDPLRDEGEAYAQKLEKGGVNVVYREYEGMIHAFINFYPFLKEGRQAIEEVDTFIDSLN